MKKPLIAATAAVILTASAAQAGPITRACLSSDRQARSIALCGCLQQVADQTLSNRDQRTAAKFFRKPQMAQDIKMSKTPRDDQFWDRYKVFGATATRFCSS